MKKFIVIAVLFFPLFVISCNKGNSTSPETDTINLIVENQKVAPGEIIQIDNYPLFVMNYNGDYGFNDYLKTGKTAKEAGDINALPAVIGKWGCTCFTAMADTCKIYGRNLDYNHHISLILYAHSPYAYSSISVADIAYLGFDKSTKVDQLKASSISTLAGSAYCSMDGLNEKGVAIGMMTVPDVQPPYDPQKVSLGCADIIRLVLDYAANTDEAVTLIQKYNYNTEENTVHFLIGDRNGKSVIVEFINSEVKIIYNNEPFQVSTNFVITGSNAPQSTTCWRYNTAYKTLKEHNGDINATSAMDILHSVSQNTTMWSAVYNMSDFSLNISIGKKYNKIYTIKVQK